jgi:hypothetical protein
MFRVLKNTKRQILTFNHKSYSKIDKSAFYSKDHEWVKFESENVGTIGKGKKVLTIRTHLPCSRPIRRYYICWNEQICW